jgi:glycerate kinase
VSASVRALASPASLKGVLTPVEAAAHLAAGLSRVAGVDVDEAPVADGGDGTAEVLYAALGGEWRTAVVSDPLGRPIGADWLVLPDGTAVVEVAAAIGLSRLKPEERNPLAASSWGLGEMLVATLTERPTSLLIGVGGTATVDGGAAMLAVVRSWLSDLPIRVACDVRNPLLGEHGAARVFGPQKGADEDAIEELEDRLSRIDRLQPYRDLPGAGAGGGLGAAFASLGGELLDGADLILNLIGFDKRAANAALVVTGEGTVDATTFNGKAPGAVQRRCAELGLRCELFGGIVRDGFDARALSGDVSLAAEDLVQLGEELALTLV